MNKLASLLSGIIFGIGLVISEMVNPAKVLGFLDLFGNWDPSLAFVMMGALVVSSPLFHIIKKKEKPFVRNFQDTETSLTSKSSIKSFFFNMLAPRARS